jgi:threonine dehydratase
LFYRIEKFKPTSFSITFVKDGFRNKYMSEKTENKYFPKLDDIQKARERLKGVIAQTPLSYNLNLSERYKANVLLKREDLQIVRSYKLRGAYNKISSLTKEEMKRGVVCASAGNHAQGVAFSCNKLGIKGTIFMPVTTPMQKIRQVNMFGKDNIEIKIIGDTFDDASHEAMQYCQEQNSVFIHPFDDPKVIEGQATIGLDILSDTKEHIDYVFIPIGGGGLASGVGSLFRTISSDTKIIGVEPVGSPTMKTSIDKGEIVTLEEIDKFADGVAVQRAGNYTFELCRQILDDIILVPEGKICTSILQLYNEDAIVVEPAGALSVAALDFYADKIKGKTVVCIISGSNNDITRMEEIKERSMLYEGLKHYFIITMPQRPGAFRDFLSKVMAPGCDITFFEYSKKTNREQGPAIIGIELTRKEDFEPLIERFKENKVHYNYLNDKPDLFQFLV